MKNIKKFLALILVIVSVLAIAAPALAAATGKYHTAAVHLRSTIGGTSLGLVSNGATCNILQQQTVGGVKWYKVKITSHTTNSPDLYNKEGWSQAQYITHLSGTIPSGHQTAEDAFGTANLSNGSKGNYVRNVQSCLANGRNQYNQPYYTGTIDGDFGSKTFLAVSSFQSERGLIPDGIVGPATRLALWNWYSQYCLY